MNSAVPNWASVHPSNRITKDTRRAGFARILMSVTLGLVWFWLIPTPARAGDPGFTEIWFNGATDSTRSVAWGDVDGDGDLDLAVGNSRAVNRLYRNDGNGNFQEVPGAFGAATDFTTSIAWGDIDGDGDLDLAVGNSGAVNRLYRNDGSENFQEVANAFGPAANFTTSVAWGDMDGDGDLDLALGNDGINRLFQNDGSGNLNEVGNNPLGMDVSVTRSLVWGDMDGDGDLDLAVGNAITSTSQLLRNDGYGSFSEVPEALTGTLQVWSLAWGDMDGDGDLDLAAGNENGANQLLQNEGNGKFSRIDGMLGDYIMDTRSVAWGDMDSDGDLDLALGNTFNDTRLFRNEGNAIFYEALNALASETRDTRSVAWGDVDGDGDLDLAVGNAMTSTNQVFRNECNGSFNQMIGSLGTAQDYSKSMAWGDMDGDGNLDLTVGNDKDQANQLFLNDENGSFSEIPGSLTETFNTWSLAWGDMDGDGDLDLAVGNFDEANQLYENKGGETLQEVNGALGVLIDPTRSLAWGDMDGDGDLDLAVGNSITSPNRLYSNEGNGHFNEIPGTLGTDAHDTYSLAWGDMNSDGDLDLAVGNNGVNQLFENDGKGNLNEIPDALGPGMLETWSLAWGDMDGDGDLDLAVGNSPGINQIFRNDGNGRFSNIVGALGPDDSLSTESVAWGDYDGDGDLDLAAGNGHQANQIFRNDGDGNFKEIPGALEEDLCYPEEKPSITGSVAWGDMDGDGDLDLAVGYSCEKGGQRNTIFENAQQNKETLLFNLPTVSAGHPYTNTANFYVHEQILNSPIIPITYTLFDPEGDPVGGIETSYSFNGGGQWFPAVATTDTVTTNLSTGRWYNQATLTPTQAIPDTGVPLNTSLVIADSGEIADVEIWLSITHTHNADLAVVLRSPSGTEVSLFSAGDAGGQGFAHTRFSGYAATSVLSGTAPYTRTYRPVGNLANFKRQAINGIWTLVITDIAGEGSGTLEAWGLRLKTPPATHLFKWDTFASGFFGQSDNVAFRMVAHPQPSRAAVNGTYKYYNTIPGPFQRPYASSTTFPFRVRGTQVQVINGTQAVSQAIVYRLPQNDSVGGVVMGQTIANPFTTNGQGYLNGRGQIEIGDRLLALAPVNLAQALTWADGLSDIMRLYYTNGVPTPIGLEVDTVNQPGVQQLTVSAEHPLLLFDIDVSLEWDASNDPGYLDRLEFDLKKASQHLYDFTDGQIALGQITLFQNADNWNSSHVVVHATNQLRPFAAIGGIVLTDTTYLGGTRPITYGMGQVHMGATWNRYGDPGQVLGMDWPLILAHELGHYFLFLEDTYLGLNEDQLLIAVGSCSGSAMGDVYNADNSEFIADLTDWQADGDDRNCQDTLAQVEMEQPEWPTIREWFPWLHPPTTKNPGPDLMSFALTSIEMVPPLTPTTVLADPSFYLDYDGGEVSAPDARAFLFRNKLGTTTGLDNYEYIYDLGRPVGGQNRLLARGAQPGDRLCVFDPSHAQYGCEKIESGDERLDMKKDKSWTPVIRITPVNSTSFIVRVENLKPTLTLKARLYPEFGSEADVIDLIESGGIYSGTLNLQEPALVGDVQVWVDEAASETNPRREALVAYSIGGNPGHQRGSGGGHQRGSGGGHQRGSGGGHQRGSGGGHLRSGGAPLVSPDGQMIFFTLDDLPFDEGEFYTVQEMAGLPPLPDGKKAIGRGYTLFATAGAPKLTLGSISFQYRGNDVLLEEASEAELTIHHWNGERWQALSTYRDAYFNLVSAPSAGKGVYALLAGTAVPTVAQVLPSDGTNDRPHTLVISGGYYLEPVQVTLVGPTATYTLPIQSIGPYSLTAVVTNGLQAREYQVVVVNRNEPGGAVVSPTPGVFALYGPEQACFYDSFESGAGKWQADGEWAIGILPPPSGEWAITDSPEGNYHSALPPALTRTTMITSKPFTLTNCVTPTLTFLHNYVLAQVGDSQDVARVEISTNGGARWTELSSYSGGGIYGLHNADISVPEWTGVQWKDVAIDLSAYISNTVRLRFSLEVDQTASDKGWLIDKIRVGTNTQTVPSNNVFLPVIFKEQ